jgi:hypothetical protein
MDPGPLGSWGKGEGGGGGGEVNGKTGAAGARIGPDPRSSHLKV